MCYGPLVLTLRMLKLKQSGLGSKGSSRWHRTKTSLWSILHKFCLVRGLTSWDKNKFLGSKMTRGSRGMINICSLPKANIPRDSRLVNSTTIRNQWKFSKFKENIKMSLIIYKHQYKWCTYVHILTTFICSVFSCSIAQQLIDLVIFLPIFVNILIF